MISKKRFSLRFDLIFRYFSPKIMVISKKPYAIIVIGLEWSSSFAKLIFKVGLNSLNSFATQNGRSRDPNLGRDPLFADL